PQIARATLLLLGCSILSVALTLTAFGQGQVDFDNLVSGSVDAPVFDNNCTNKLSGASFVAQLYASASSDPTTLAAVGAVFVFGSGPSAGYFSGGTQTIPGVSPGSTAFLQVRAWESTFASYTAAVAG